MKENSNHNNEGSNHLARDDKKKPQYQQTIN